MIDVESMLHGSYPDVSEHQHTEVSLFKKSKDEKEPGQSDNEESFSSGQSNKENEPPSDYSSTKLSVLTKPSPMKTAANKLQNAAKRRDVRRKVSASDLESPAKFERPPQPGMKGPRSI
jgi:hypothetical protein